MFRLLIALLSALQSAPLYAKVLAAVALALGGTYYLFVVRRCTWRDIYKFLASLQFAIVLLSVIIVAVAVGTIYETRFNADIAQKYIYSNWWFNIWLGALCVNLFCVAAIRYPWKRHQTGFVITHAGIITLLIGAMIDRMWGIEGFIHLHTTKQGSNVMELREQDLSLKIDGKVAHNRLKINTISRPQSLESPLPEVKVGIARVEVCEKRIIAAPTQADDPEQRPGLNLTLQGPMMGRNEHSIFLRQSQEMGPAKIAFVTGVPKLPADLKDGKADLDLDFMGKSFHFPVKYGEPKELDLEGFPGWKIAIKGYYPDVKLIDKEHLETSDPNDLTPHEPCVNFELIGPEVRGINIKVDPAAEHVQQIPQDPNKVAPQYEKFYVFANNHYPVINKLQHGPSTGASATLLIPRLSSDYITGTMPDGSPRINGLVFFLGEDGVLRYYLKARDRSVENQDEQNPKTIERTGEVELEKATPVGWGAPGTEFVVHDFIKAATLKTTFVPTPDVKIMDKEEEAASLGAECEVTVNGETKTLWVGQTLVDWPNPQELEVGGKKVNFEFKARTVILPFTVKLKQFRAPTDEGSNEFAAFESDLLFKNMECEVTLNDDFIVVQPGADSKSGMNPMIVRKGTTGFGDPVPISQSFNDPIHYNRDGKIVLDGVWLGEFKANQKEFVNRYNYDDYMTMIRDFKAGDKTIGLRMVGVDGVHFKNQEVKQTISMNRPCTFPMTWYGPWMGVCYKFSQASHHTIPGSPDSDPDYSGVQVLRDPGWLLKWVGCIMICSGIFTMFYIRPYFNRPKTAPAIDAMLDGKKKKKKKK